MGYRLEAKGPSWESLGKEVQGRVNRVVRVTTQAVTDDAKINAPVLTGFLRSTIQMEMVDDHTGVVNVGADYGPFVEEGTSHMAAQPYLDPAVEMNRNPFYADLAAALEGGQ